MPSVLSVLSLFLLIVVVDVLEIALEQLLVHDLLDSVIPWPDCDGRVDFLTGKQSHINQQVLPKFWLSIQVAIEEVLFFSVILV